ncbi:MAG: glutathione S-transferase family protein [Myxococcota bacterium]
MRLVTIPISHYCEKARWGLDLCGAPYVEEAHVQMLHWPHVLWAGRTKLAPVLVDGSTAVGDSSEILRHLAERFPSLASLYPPEHRDEIHSLESRLDAFGRQTRRLFYEALTGASRDDLIGYNCHGVPRWESSALHLLAPFFARFATRYLDVSPETVDVAHRDIEAMLDDIERRLQDGRPYLFGETFTAADLSFAALSAPISFPPEYGVPIPSREQILAVAPQAARYWARPAVEHAVTMYAKHRRPADGASQAV